MFQDRIVTPIVEVKDEITKRFGVQLFIKREDLTDPFISGNKYRKLKYNLLDARQNDYKTLLTFGGAYSNHIHAVAYGGSKFGFKTIGIIRGEETLPLNPTLKDASSLGMQLQYISRSDYRNKYDTGLVRDLNKKYGNFYLIPEGGSNRLAVKGSSEILTDIEKEFDHICCACGTGGTIAGIIVSLEGKNKVWGFPALKQGKFLEKDIATLIYDYNSLKYKNWGLVLDYHFGGYAKHTKGLIDFINNSKNNIISNLTQSTRANSYLGYMKVLKTSFLKEMRKYLQCILVDCKESRVSTPGLDL